MKEKVSTVLIAVVVILQLITYTAITKAKNAELEEVSVDTATEIMQEADEAMVEEFEKIVLEETEVVE